MNETCRPTKMQILAWMRYRRTIAGPPPDGEQIRRALRWTVQQSSEGDIAAAAMISNNTMKRSSR